MIPSSTHRTSGGVAPVPACACPQPSESPGFCLAQPPADDGLADLPDMRIGCEKCRAGMPEPLWRFMCGKCRLPAHALQHLPEFALPEPNRQLLMHTRDMTSTLTTFHRSPLRVEILQQSKLGEAYLREVFLRTREAGRIVEYGVIAILLRQFTTPQQAAIQSGEAPLGGLLHHFEIPFTSAPVGFFSVSTAILPQPPLTEAGPARCYGRFNRLSKPTGEPLAWIMEILPPLPAA